MPDNEKLQQGIVRRIDDLGRIVIPKELRRAMRITEGDTLAMTVDNGILYTVKYQYDRQLDSILDNLDAVLEDFRWNIDSETFDALHKNINNMRTLIKKLQTKQPETKE